jgi:type IV pilus modification protein PilV
MSAPRRAVRLRTASAAGFTLVETLIAMFVLAVGLLGCASLLAWSLFESGVALRREQALVVASDLAERVRANGGVPDAAGLAEWRTQIASYGPMLAALETSFAVDPPAGPAGLERVDIALRWREPRAAGGSASLVLRVHRRPPLD